MFNGNSEYQAVFDKIGKVHSHGLKHNMSIPQMAIIGDQSSGKSSVLEALTKLSFPRDKGMCTRFAILVNLQRNPTLPRDVMSAKIEGEDAFNKRFAVVEALITFDGVIGEAVTLLCKNIDISDKVLELTLSGPSQSPLSIIDLQGFILTTEDAQDKTLPEAIRAINRRFIQDPRTIILSVVPANVDLITSTSLSEASAYDPEGERTIPIVNGHYLDGWRSVTEDRILKMHENLSKALSLFISHIADALARDVFTHVFERFSQAQVTSIKTTIQDIFGEESTPFHS